MPNEQEQKKIAMDHAWAWFSLHATQRLQAVNFFLIAAAFLSAGFVTAAKDGKYALAGGVAVLSILISYIFYRMERRIRSLIHAAENAIEPLQDELATSLGVDSLRIVSNVRRPLSGEWAYSKVFRYLYLTTGGTFALGLLYVAWAAFNTTPGATEFNVVVQAILGIFLIVSGYEMLFGLPRTAQPDNVQTGTRWSLLTLGVVCVLAGAAVVCHLVFVRL